MKIQSMNASISTKEHQKEFARSLYREHLEDASFLYEQRKGLLNDPNNQWTDLETFEGRFEAHIDALVIGNDLALEGCREQREMDFGEHHAAMRVFCRQGRMDLLRELLDSTDLADKDEHTAISDALCHDLPQSMIGECIDFLMEKGGPRAIMAADIIRFRRIQAQSQLQQLFNQNQPDTIAAALSASGRIREKAFENQTLNFLNENDEHLCRSAALYLLRIGIFGAVRTCLDQIQNHDWPLLLSGISAGPSSLPVLMRRVETEGSKDALMAIGFLGDMRSVEPILKYFESPDLKEAAALSLNLITGADIFEEVFIPESIDEDELFEDEIERLKKGENLYPPGEEPGEIITRLSQDPAVWKEWWSANRSRFKSDIRYRNGEPFSPACLLQNLESEQSPRVVRQLAYEELVIRYNVDFPFETDMFVGQQKAAMANFQEWITVNGKRFQEGKWYFAGKVIGP